MWSCSPTPTAGPTCTGWRGSFRPSRDERGVAAAAAGRTSYRSDLFGTAATASTSCTSPARSATAARGTSTRTTSRFAARRSAAPASARTRSTGAAVRCWGSRSRSGGSPSASSPHAHTVHRLPDTTRRAAAASAAARRRRRRAGALSRRGVSAARARWLARLGLPSAVAVLAARWLCGLVALASKAAGVAGRALARRRRGLSLIHVADGAGAVIRSLRLGLAPRARQAQRCPITATSTAWPRSAHLDVRLETRPLPFAHARIRIDVTS